MKLMFHSISAITIEKIIRIGTSTILFILLYKELAPRDFDDLVFYLNYSSLFVLISVFGQSDYIIAGKDLSLSQRTLSALMLTFALSIILMGISIFLMNFFFHQLQESARIFILASFLILGAINILLRSMYEAKQKFLLVSIIGIITVSIFLIIKVFIITTLPDDIKLLLLLITLTIEIIVECCILLLFSKENIFYDYRRCVAEIFVNKRIRSGAWIAAAGLNFILFQKVDIFLLTFLGEHSLLGEYALASKVYELNILLSSVLVIYYFPQIAKVYNSDGRHTCVNFLRSYRLKILLVSCLLALLIIFTVGVINTLTDINNPLIIRVAILYATILPIIVFSAFFSKLYILNDDSNFVALRLIFGNIMNIIASLVFFQFFGVFGVALGTVVALTYMNFVHELFSAKGRTYLNVKYGRKSIESHNSWT